MTNRTPGQRERRRVLHDAANGRGSDSPAYSPADYRARHGDPAKWTPDECDEYLDAMRAAEAYDGCGADWCIPTDGAQ
ncbi:hypothetical protein [Streptomyces gilvosporeus]|uniref:hypothetical protein n=1 Tax=Streptomyces gilvosporeus TaxID=553510 RepID=UPI0033E9730D